MRYISNKLVIKALPERKGLGKASHFGLMLLFLLMLTIANTVQAVKLSIYNSPIEEVLKQHDYISLLPL